MARHSVRFVTGDSYWLQDREGIGFVGKTDLGQVEFIITSAALAQMLNPDFEILDAETALEVFAEFESDIHRIAQFEFVKRLGGEPPILLTAADVELH